MASPCPATGTTASGAQFAAPVTRALLNGLLLAVLLVVVGCAKKSSTAPEVVTNACPDQPGVICTWAGNGELGFNGDGRPLLESRLYWPMNVTVTPDGVIYIVDWNNDRIRRVTAQGTLETIIGTDFIGDGPPDSSDLVPPGAPGTTVLLNHPTDFVPLKDGTILLVAWHNHKLRVYDPATDLVLVTCGGDYGFTGDGGPAKDALLSQPPHAVQASDGSIYVNDQRNQRIRRIDPGGMIQTVVGSTPIAPYPYFTYGGFSGDGGPPLDAEINQPSGPNPQPGGGLAMDAQDRLYIADVLNHRIRRVDFNANVIETVVGNGVATFGGDGGPGVQASINDPREIEIGPDGRLYICDYGNHRIRAWDPVTGIITTVAGNGRAEFSGDGGPAVDAGINRPCGLAFDADGHMYIADTFNHRIRRVKL